jgi:hypothetical protein
MLKLFRLLFVKIDVKNLTKIFLYKIKELVFIDKVTFSIKAVS